MAYAVPNVPGVPPLLGGLIAVALPPLVTADAIGVATFGLGPRWGIFKDGAPVVYSDNVVSMDARKESVIADFPIEGGGFESYDKVRRPFDVRFRLSTGGSVAARSAMIQSVKAIADDFELYMFVAPDDVWENVNVQHFDYHRAAEHGNGLFFVDVWGWQIQLNTSSSLANTQSPASADPTVSAPAANEPSIAAHASAMSQAAASQAAAAPYVQNEGTALAGI